MASEVWKSFKKAGGRAMCTCGEELTLPKSGSTTHLSGHLKSVRHKEKMANKELGPSETKKARVEPIATLFSPGYSRQQSQLLINDITDFIVDSNLPFSISESPYLRRLIKHNYGQAMLPSRHDITAEVPMKAANCMKDLSFFVKGQQISLTLDEFSHKEHSLLCVTGSYLTESFEYRSKVLAVESFLEKHTGDNIAVKINSSLAELEINKKDVVAATRDGALNLAGPKTGGCVKANIKSFHCFCHVLHLVVWDGIDKTLVVSSVVEKASKIGIGFHRIPTAMSAFRAIQGTESTSLALQVKTRWNSTLKMLSSVLDHKVDLLKYAEQFPLCTVAKHIRGMSENDSEEIADVVKVLQPFKDCTKMIGRSYSPKKYLSVLAITIGIIICTLATSLLEKKTEETFTLEEAQKHYHEWMIGIAMLTVALLVSSYLAICQERMYTSYGKHPREAMFYIHSISLPFFVFMGPDILKSAIEFTQAPPLQVFGYSVLGWLGVSHLWVKLLGACVMQWLCILFVYRLNSEVDSLTVTLVVTLRKFLSLVVSIVWFQNPFTWLHWIGAALVFGGTLVFSDVISVTKKDTKKIQ